MNSLIHIAPQLPPAIDGVGDYCRNLWQHWSEPQPDWTFLVMRGASATHRVWPEVTIREFCAGKAALVAALKQSEGATVVLHYVSYGFQPKGLPLWLPGAIREWKQAAPGRRLVTMFHEMYARSSPWRSPFWLMPWARSIIRELVQLSDAWVTSCDRFFNQLTKEFAADPTCGGLIPIGSNIPLVAHRNVSADHDARRLNVVLFGLAKTRLWALERHWHLLRALVSANLVNTITLAGRRVELMEDECAWERFAGKIGSARWERRFDLSAAELSALLAQQHIGLLANGPDALTKSGVFAALTSHGVVPIVAARSGDVLAGPLSSVAIANTDEPERIGSIVSLLSDAARHESYRNAGMEFAAEELAWHRITDSWTRMLSRQRPGASSRASLAPARRKGVSSTNESHALSETDRPLVV